MTNDVQELVSCRQEMMESAKVMGELARPLAYIYYCIDGHEHE